MKEKLLGILVVGGNMAKNILKVSFFMVTSCTATLRRDEPWKMWSGSAILS